MSTTAKLGLLRALRRLGVSRFTATSALGHPFVCHIGDLAGEAPFYNVATNRAELILMAAWCSQETRPVIYDVGANLGFVSTQLAQMLRGRNPHVIAFEPVWSTFQKLEHSVRILKLSDSVTPVCCAISDRAGFVSIAFDERRSLFAQVRTDRPNERAGLKTSWAPTQTLDEFQESFKTHPTLLKVDVEGLEAHVFRGAQKLLSGPNAPAIMFELNPLTLHEVGSTTRAIIDALPGYLFVYIDDFEGQIRQCGESLQDITTLHHVCNLLALPDQATALKRWFRCVEVLSLEPVSVPLQSRKCRPPNKLPCLNVAWRKPRAVSH